MKVVLFHDNDRYAQKLKNIVQELEGHNSIIVEYSSLFEPYDFDQSFFSIFLLTPHHAASQPLLANVKALTEAGANEKSILFLINDKERVTPEERVLITTEVMRTLHTYVKEPEIQWCSSHGYNLYQTYKEDPQHEKLKKELVYTYWNQNGEPQTLQDMMNGQLMSLVLEDSGIPMLLDFIEQQMLSLPQRAERREASKQHVMLVGEHRLIRDSLTEQDNIVVHELESLKQLEKEATTKDIIMLVIEYEQLQQYDYKKLNSFSNVVVLVDGSKHRNIWEIDLEEASNQFGIYPNISFLTVNSYYLECLKVKKTREELINDRSIVIRGQYGLPVYKDKVSNWDEALFKESGLPEVLKVIS